MERWDGVAWRLPLLCAQLTKRAWVCCAEIHCVTIGHVAKDTLTFRIEPGTKAALDTLAVALDRDRSYIINEAVDAYLDTQRWQIAHIKQGMKQADEGKFVSDRQMKTLVNKLLRK